MVKRYLAGLRPGSLIHIDVKKLGRVPDGGRRVHGRSEPVR
ncbi:hypothetical protein [Myceligenerans xiligouense]|nr:hypothetical protein [Myceligenerans xiligouense]